MENEVNYYAHSKENEPPEKWQPLEEHLANVATLAAKFAEKFGAKEWGRIAGLWHDLGKSSQEFQDYLKSGADCHSSDMATKTDHSTAGAQYAVQSLDILGFLLAYVISGHHSGLLDAISEHSSLEKRLQKQVQEWHNSFAKKLNSNLQAPESLLSRDDASGFRTAFFTRMLYSCLVDADFMDTEKFMNYQQFEIRDNWDHTILQEMMNALTSYLNSISSDYTNVNKERAKILTSCLIEAESQPGLFSLSVPTGGGKTLSSLAFALKHAIKHKKNRIIYVIPFTSIIEQNADVFRKVFSSLSKDIILEHHSNFDQKKETTSSRLATENWNAPLVVTTSVQFYESLFANKSSKCRKLHNIANSVIILDEAQTLPVNFLKPSLKVLGELTKSFNSTIVLCTATQPEIKKRDNFPIGLESVKEIIPDRETLYLNLKRTDTNYVGSKSDAELAEEIITHRQSLCIVNTRKHAKLLYDEMKNKENVFHLSALMCPAHRSEILNQVKNKLKNNDSCLLISTQLIEAGVDIDFPVVFRSLAGLDSIAQAAGRCNREGLLDTGQVFIFKSEHTRNESYFSETVNSATQVIELFKEDPLSLEAVEQFFKLYYWDQKSKWDAKQLFQDFKLVNNRDMPFLFNFKTAAQKFKLIDNNYGSIIIPWGKIGQTLSERARKEFPNRQLSRQLQRYTVNIRQYLWDRNFNRIFTLEQEKYPILTSLDVNYSAQTGLNLDENNDNNAFFA